MLTNFSPLQAKWLEREWLRWERLFPLIPRLSLQPQLSAESDAAASSSDKSDWSSSDDMSVQLLSLSSDCNTPALLTPARCGGNCSCVPHDPAASALVECFLFCENFASNPFCASDCWSDISRARNPLLSGTTLQHYIMQTVKCCSSVNSDYFTWLLTKKNRIQQFKTNFKQKRTALVKFIFMV